MLRDNERKIGKTGEPWYIELNEFHAAIFAWLWVLFDHPPVLCLSPGERERGVVPLCDVVGVN